MLYLALLFRQGVVGSQSTPFSLQARSIHQTASKLYRCRCLTVKCLMDALLVVKARGVPRCSRGQPTALRRDRAPFGGL